MHVLLVLSSFALVLVASALALRSLARVQDWARRRDIQLLVLLAPVVSLGGAVLALGHFSGRPCFLSAPGWDYRLGLALPLALASIAVGGLILGIGRLVLLHWLLAGRGVPVPALEAQADALAARLGTTPTRVRAYPSDRPVALTHGFVRQRVLLSTWMVEHLDASELESVLAHELAHVARRDCLVIWLATVLRDAFFYLPTSRLAHRRLQGEKEFACDDMAACATGEPLALASALGKVWLRGPALPFTALAQRLSGADASIEARIERLLDDEPMPYNAGPRVVALASGAAALTALLVIQGINFAAALAPMGCGVASRGL